MSELKTFNINKKVYVKLTEVGKKELKRQHEELTKANPNYKIPYLEPAVDKDGFSVFQLWDLMNKLGWLCVMGSELPFETEIKLEK